MKRQLSVVALIGLLGLLSFLVYTGVYIFVYLFRAFRTVEPSDRVGGIWHGDPFARAIFVAIPVTLTFFLPFLASERLGLGFWQAYALGCVLLPIGFFAHRLLARLV